MKKILLLFLSVFLVLAPVNAQILRTNPYYTNNTIVAEEEYCDEYQAVYDAMVSLGNPPTAGVATVQNTLVEALKTAGVWTKLNIFYCFAQYSNTAGEALLNWINPATFTCVVNGTVTFTSLQGIAGNGSTGWLQTNFHPGADGAGKFTQDAASIGFYQRVNQSGTYISLGLQVSGTDLMLIRPRYNTNRFYAALSQSSAAGYKDVPAADSRGFYVVTKVNSTTITLYRNGTDLGDLTVTSYAITSSHHLVFLMNDGGSYSTNQLSFGFAGGLLSDTEVADMNTAIEAYMDSPAVGYGVE